LEVSDQLHAPAALTPAERVPGTNSIRVWVCPKAGLDDVEKTEFLTIINYRNKFTFISLFVIRVVNTDYTSIIIYNRIYVQVTK
jgi:hypothetical protein